MFLCEWGKFKHLRQENERNDLIIYWNINSVFSYSQIISMPSSFRL